MYCHNCGNELADDDSFCGKCGTEVVGVDAPAAQAAPQVVTSQAAASAQQASSSKKPIIIVAIIAIVALLALICVFIFTQGQNNQKSGVTQTTTCYPVQVVLSFGDLEALESSPVPLEVTGQDLAGTKVTETFLYELKEPKTLDLPEGNYQIIVSTSPILSDGTIFDTSNAKADLVVGADNAGNTASTITTPKLELRALDSSQVTEEQIQNIRDGLVGCGVDPSKADAYKSAAISKMTNAQEQAAKQSKRLSKAGRPLYYQDESVDVSGTFMIVQKEHKGTVSDYLLFKLDEPVDVFTSTYPHETEPAKLYEGIYGIGVMNWDDRMHALDGKHGRLEGILEHGGKFVPTMYAGDDIQFGGKCTIRAVFFKEN